MWECRWLNMRTSPDIKQFLDSKFPNCNPKWEMTQQQVLKNIVDGNLFGIVECDILVPDHLRTYFAEMQPIFKNANISRDDIGEFMYSYAIKHDILKQPCRSLIGSNSTSNSTFKMVPETRYQIIEYEPSPCCASFADTVSDARREGDVHPDKTITADTMKLIGNSAYGKCATDLSKQKNVYFVMTKLRVEE